MWNEGEAVTRAAQLEHARTVDQAHRQAPPGASVTLPFHDPGEAKRQAARDMLARARRQLAAAGEQAADVVGRARNKAPEKSWLGQALDAVGEVAGAAVNAVASFGNAAVQHPELLAGLVGGVALTAVSSVGMAGGVVLDATGAGALAGGPLTYASGAGIVTGAGIIGSAAMALGAEAAGDDEVEVIDTTDEPPAPLAGGDQPQSGGEPLLLGDRREHRLGSGGRASTRCPCQAGQMRRPFGELPVCAGATAPPPPGKLVRARSKHLHSGRRRDSRMDDVALPDRHMIARHDGLREALTQKSEQ